MVLRAQRLLLASLICLSSASLAQSEDEDEEQPSDVRGQVEASNEAAPSADEAAALAPSGAAAQTPDEPSNTPAEKAAEPATEETATQAEAVPATDASGVDDKESEAKETKHSTARNPGSYFGLGVGKVTDLGKYNHYKIFYGKEENMMLFHAGAYLYSKGIDMGYLFKFGYYSASGHPLTTLGGLKAPVKEDLPEDTATDPNQQLKISLIPAQVLLNLAYSPFQSRRVVLRGWFGYEFLHVEETLSANVPKGVSNSGVSRFTLSGWNQGVVTGGMLSISLSGVETRSDYALHSIGVEKIYLSPFFESVKTTKDKMGNYDRKMYGILIDFEGIR